MRFMVDECTGPKVAEWLKEKGHEVFSIYDEARGIADEDVIKIADQGKYILITNDKDFGELIFRSKKSHKGIVLLRLETQDTENKIMVLKNLLELYPDKLQNNFVVVTEKTVRIIESPSD